MTPLRSFRSMTAALVAAVVVTGTARAQRGARATADIVLINGNILTVDGTDRVVQAVAIAGNKIIAVGTDEEAEAFTGPTTRTVDLKGKTVTPGLIDAHIHFADGGLNRVFIANVGFPDARSIDDIKRIVGEQAAKLGAPSAWIEGAGWDEGKLTDRRYVTAKDLDEVSGAHPAWLEHTTGHYGVANSAALRLAGITKASKDPPNGTIDRDANGEPTGVLKESAQELVRRHIPARSQKDFEAGITDLAKAFAAEGMTGAKEPGIGDVEWNAYRAVAARGDLPVRVFALWSGGSTEKEARALIAKRAATTHPYASTGDDHVISGGVKLFMDGSGGARTAWVYDPWYRDGKPDGENRGYPAANPDTLRKLIKLYHDAGMPVGTHAIGDRAIDWTVESYALALAAKPTKGLRHSVIHANIPTDKAIAEMARLEQAYDAVYPEPSSNFTWWIGDNYMNTFGPARRLRLNPFATFLKNGIPWANGSDFFVTPFPGRLSIWAAVARETLLGASGDPFGRAESVDVHAALKSVTIWAARQIFLDKKAGSIEVGKYADLAIWDRDFYTVPTADIREAQCLMTIFNGKVVYQQASTKF